MASFRSGEISATAAAQKLELGRSRFYLLYAQYLRAVARHQQGCWAPGVSGGDHAPGWPVGVEPLLRKLLSAKPPAPYRFAASEVHRRLGFAMDPATVRRWAMAKRLAHPLPPPRPPASLRRWQCLKTGALWQLDATPHRWFPADHKNYPLLDLLDDCSRVCTGAKIYYREDLLAYFEFLPAAFLEHGLPLELYVDCHSLFFPQHPGALTQLGAALKAAQREKPSVLRRSPRCPWWPYIWSVRTPIKVDPDGRVPIGHQRLRVGVSAGSRVIHCQHPSGSISILAHEPKNGDRPALLLQVGNP